MERVTETRPWVYIILPLLRVLDLHLSYHSADSCRPISDLGDPSGCVATFTPSKDI